MTCASCRHECDVCGVCGCCVDCALENTHLYADACKGCATYQIMAMGMKVDAWALRCDELVRQAAGFASALKRYLNEHNWDCLDTATCQACKSPGEADHDRWIGPGPGPSLAQLAMEEESENVQRVRRAIQHNTPLHELEKEMDWEDNKC